MPDGERDRLCVKVNRPWKPSILPPRSTIRPCKYMFDRGSKILPPGTENCTSEVGALPRMNEQ
eukprot:8866592-Alexandrium_andersonii.AAC.1